MNKKLTRNEVMHVAHLARINISEEELEKYQMDLAQMIDEIDKIKDLNDFDNEMIFTPCEEKVKLENSSVSVDKDNLLTNAPGTKGNFIEVPVMINE